ncbi:MAG: amino acid ABC transporter permease [Clostridia bacterium]
MVISNMSLEQIGKLTVQMIEASGVTLQIFFITALFSVPLGILVAVGRMSKFKIISAVVRFYQFIMRGTPLILQLMFIYFAPKYIALEFGVTLSYTRFSSCVFACIINYSAYLGEIFRGGIESIPKGQYEAGKVLGYSKVQTFIYIILPQVIKRILPSLGNEFMVLIKDTALVSVVAVTELYQIATKMASTHASVLPYILAGVMYLILNSVIEQIFIKLEKRYSYYS